MITKSNLQSGQTLIETLVAALVLVMGITAAVTLAIYGFTATEGINKQLIAVGLAREAMEAVKNMRDTNWLYTDLSTDCHDFYTTIGDSNVASCYRDWQKNLADGTYVLSFNTQTSGLDSPDFWSLVPSTNYSLKRNLNDSQLEQGFYIPAGTGKGNSDFSRKITLTSENFPPFDYADLGPRMKVHVDVWWEADRCPYKVDVPSSSACKISIETYLTNWKNY